MHFQEREDGHFRVGEGKGPQRCEWILIALDYETRAAQDHLHPPAHKERFVNDHDEGRKLVYAHCSPPRSRHQRIGILTLATAVERRIPRWYEPGDAPAYKKRRL